jgi:voltage-gated potassium channel Kch
MNKERLKYTFDNIMSKGTVSAIILLLIVSFIIVVFIATSISLMNIFPEGEKDVNFFEAVWISMTRTLDPGTMGEDTGWAFRALMFLATAYGIVMVSTFIGLISNGILSKIIELRKGRSRVMEKNHILILGWSTKIYTIVSELVIANENQHNPIIVILANKDKVEMEDELKEKVPDRKNTKIICRSGDPIDINDLEIGNPYFTKSIILLDSHSENSDAEIIKVILALTTKRNERESPYHITAEIESKKNLDVAKMVGKEEVELILSDEFISRIMVQTSRQSGLSVVYTDLLDFAGDEIYFQEEPKIVGKTFEEALFLFNESSVIGLQLKDERILLNPPLDTIIEKGSKVIAISADDDTVTLSNKKYSINEEAISTEDYPGLAHGKILILGWNRKARIIIRELASYSNTISTISVVAELHDLEDTISKLNEDFPSTKIEYSVADTTDRDVLENLEINDYEHLLLLSYEDHYKTQQADAKTLITLLHLRNIGERWGMVLNIVSEMLDVKNRELASVTNADDFIVSDNIISLIIAQVAENKFLMQIFEQLFKAEGNEIYLKPAIGYVEPDIEVDFYTILASALKKNEIAIGYRMMEHCRDEKMNYGIELNPVKSKKITLSSIDFVIVLAES